MVCIILGAIFLQTYTNLILLHHKLIPPRSTRTVDMRCVDHKNVSVHKRHPAMKKVSHPLLHLQKKTMWSLKGNLGELSLRGVVYERYFSEKTLTKALSSHRLLSAMSSCAGSPGAASIEIRFQSSLSVLLTKCVMCPVHRQEALLAAISEKDANIALLELSSSKKKKTQEEVAALKREKDGLVHQLKQQVRLFAHTASSTSDIRADTFGSVV